MGTLTHEHRTVGYQWASDVAFDGIRLEVLSDEGEILFDVSVPNTGPITVNTFGKEIAADLMMIAVQTAKRQR
ncbi:hypothetical protein [Sphingomonas sp. IC081]|uniref:hypothetical protein n=1 Tax=Sphingomonas sp. IC081 TaxID=304378 RepID=UPI001158EA2E|nr:hypothetical protein [Sphingomonas sp. IC081]QDK32559.1 hypothetical protein DM450_07135 [Sphingomonas sp. IC081]